MYSLIISYPHAHHVPTNSLSPTVSIITGTVIKLDRKPLVKMINTIFDGRHEELFGKSEMIMGEPESIVLTTKDVMEHLRLS